ncbi:MAG: hypothetical protein ACKOX7_03530 [Bacteroidota bacterium]
MRTLDIPNPNDESAESLDQTEELDYSDTDSILGNVFLDSIDTNANDSMPNLRNVSMDTTSGATLPTNSSLKNVDAVFLSVECVGSRCELIFESEADGEIRFCGAYGDFVSADLRSANRELIGKKFMLIYRTTSVKGKTTADIGSTTTCNIIVFAKPL